MMKRILALVLLALLTRTAYADTCSKNLMPPFTSAQATELCATFVGTSTVSATLTPGSDNAYDLGSASFQFRTAYIGTTLITPATGKLRIGSADALNADATTYLVAAPLISTVGAGATQSHFGIFQVGANANGVDLVALKTRSTGTDANTIVQSGDTVMSLIGAAADGVDYQSVARTLYQIDGTPGAGDMPGKIVFQTVPDGSATLTTAMTIASTGIITLARAADLNFAVGAATLGLQEAVAGTACMGTATCNGATDVTTATTCATTGSRIFLQRSSADTDGVGQMYVKSISNGVNFVVNCVTANDTSTFNWIIFHESP